MVAVLPQSSAAARALQLSLGVVMGWFLADDLSGRLRQGCADFDVLKKINPESAKEKAQVRCVFFVDRSGTPRGLLATHPSHA